MTQEKIKKKIQKKYVITEEVWRWPGYAGWHFVTVPKKISADIKKVALLYGAGFVKVQVTLGNSVWTTALFPHTDSGAYLISIKKSVRNKEGVFEGQKVKITFVLV